MNYFKKLHNRRSPAGLELVILKKLPKYLLAGSLIPAFMSIFIRLFPLDVLLDDVAKQQMTIDILAIALVVTVWTAVFTIAIGCTIVWVMKGPAYVADAYQLEDSSRPRSTTEK
jgi:hypothetical protein